MSGELTKVDVRAVLRDCIEVLEGEGCHFSAGRLEAAYETLANLIAALEEVRELTKSANTDRASLLVAIYDTAYTALARIGGAA